MNADTVTIHFGDTLQWNWRRDILLTLCITKDFPSAISPNPTPCNGIEFSNHNSPSTISYQFTFREEGVYFTITHVNLDPGRPVLGTIVVMKDTPPPSQIRIFVQNYEADYNFTAVNVESSAGNSDAGSAAKRKKRNSLDPLANDISDDDACEQIGSTGQDAIEGQLSFQYSQCFTPVLQEVVPNTGSRLDTEFSLYGDMFSNNTASNEVMIGNLSCIPLSSTKREVTCQIHETTTSDTSALLPKAFMLLNVSLRVAEEGRGNAFVTNISTTQVVLCPIIYSISPSIGSLAGGVNVTIIGDMFSFTAETSSGLRLNFPCIISEFHFTKIKCNTEAVQSTETFNVSLYSFQQPLKTLCGNSSSCTFTFSEAHTPKVTLVTPSTVSGPSSTVLFLEGSGFSIMLDENVVTVGNSHCFVINASEDSINCTLGAMPAGSYTLSLEILNHMTNKSLGLAVVSSDASIITVDGILTSVSPTTGSVFGDTELTITGFGFHETPLDTSVLIGGSPCTNVQVVNLTTLQCATTMLQTEGLRPIEVTSNSVSFTNVIDFQFALGSTPQVTSISPSSGRPGVVIKIQGLLFPASPTTATITIKIGESECPLDPSLSNETFLTCIVGENIGGDYAIEVVVHALGRAMNSPGIQFFYIISIDVILPSNGSFAGMNTVIIQGVGFDRDNTTIKICDQPCPLDAVPTIYKVECIISATIFQEMLQCDVILSSPAGMAVVEQGYTYLAELTPVVISINRTRGGTQGGSAIRITVQNLAGSASVSIVGNECSVINQDGNDVECITGASNRTVCGYVLVRDGDTAMYALSDVEFCYVDLWSSPFTWGGGPLPQDGDFVVVKKGQTLVLDIHTPILSFLLIQGKLVFDQEAEDGEVELHSRGILITSGGCLEVGTEDEPFIAKTEIVLHGNVLSTEIPIYGAKSLALRKGCIDMHGRPLNVTWTKLAKTAPAGSSMLYLVDTVDWEVGGKIVIASTSFSQRENEKTTIASVEYSGVGGVGSVLTLTEPLGYEHISVRQVIAGKVITKCAEVGYLTRNIVVRGTRNEESEVQVTGCDEDFDPGQFAVQSCFLGRFGNETVSDQFGAQIMIHPQVKSQGDVFGRFEYVEVTWAGQAFRLGRYPIHFHLAGDVSGSYVRGCAVHRTFNRAVTVHGVDNLLVERNVAYDILGHAYFLEDGNEENNIIQDNLGVFVRGSSSLLNVDITPATFWIVNPNNYVRRNAAAGGTHFGFWFRIPVHPTGPSFNNTHCPRKQTVLEFADNTAHSFGWYGLWVFRGYDPSPTGNCWDNEHAPAYFDRFCSWHNDKGVEFVETGSMRLRDSILLDNKLAGVEVRTLSSEWDEERGAAITDTLIVGQSNISGSDICTEAGIRTPPSNYLTVSSVTFANFNSDNCYPIQACSDCKVLQGGFETRYKNISYVDVKPRVTLWQWQHEHVHRGLDGTLTLTEHPASLVPTSALLNPTQCPNSNITEDNNGVSGSICESGVGLGRMAIFSPTPTSLESTPTSLSNENGEILQQYVLKRLTGGPGYMSIVVLNKTYELTWIEGATLTNISYNVRVSNFRDEDWIIIKQRYPQELDRTFIAGMEAPLNGSIFDDPEAAETGSYSFGEDNTTLSYIIKGTHSDEDISYTTYRCQFADCIPPPPPTLPPPVPLERPDNYMNWSNTSIWPGNALPVVNDDVAVADMYVVLNIQIPKFKRIDIRNGTLELQDGMNHVIEADLIVILGGRLVAGYPDEPFQSRVNFILHGSISTPEYRLEDDGMSSPVIGAKAIAVFGELILNAVHPDWMWTVLAQTSAAGDDFIVVMDSVIGWGIGELVVITSTYYDAFQTEVLEIVSINGRNLTLNDTLRYMHVGVETQYYSVHAEVGLLSRRIVIEPGEAELAEDTSFGCRVLVSSSSSNVGSVLLSGVEFKHCGQLGFTAHDDPRFALALLNVGESRSSYITDCSFHDGFNTALGIFSTDMVEVSRNVIHGTVGPSMIIEGYGHNVTHNLASLSRFIGTYRERNDPLNSLWTANFEITESEGIDFRYNHAAGGAKAGIHTNGEDCNNSSSIIRHNIAHSTLHCVHLGYRDGSFSACSLFHNYTVYSCYHYGFFSYSRAGIVLVHSTFVWNKAAVYISVIGPPAITHIVGEKQVRIQDTAIVSADPATRCDDDSESMIPNIANHQTSHDGILSPTGGHVGVVIPSFLSGSGHFPLFPWYSINSYPAISGLTEITNVTFVNFGTGCEADQDVVIMPNRQSEDCNHPVHFREVKFVESDSGLKVFMPMPNLNRVNPSDCVDMDCDGFKAVILRDSDGSFTETDTFQTIISKAEFEWDGDPRRGIGDYRIPTALLTEPDGSQVDADALYPNKGIVRSGNLGESCMFVSDWNMYQCSGLDHLMFAMESLDEDTEVRRISPVAVAANGYVNLVNGPMDNGWCGGYTCQERISTLYAVVCSGLEYTIALTSTNPQNFSLHLLNSNNQQVIVVGIIHNTPQRLDVYITGEDGREQYVTPKNAILTADDNLQYIDGSEDEFIPTLSDSHGANFYDRRTKRIYVTIRGATVCKIITTPAIVLSVNIQVSSVDMFFAEETLVRNLALLLGIPANMIRTVDVVRESRKRRQVEGVTITVQIGSPPAPSNVTSPLGVFFEFLAEFLELGGLGDLFNSSTISVVSITLTSPVEPVVDPTNGVRATPETGGPQPGDDVRVPTFYEQQLELERLLEDIPDSFLVSIPSFLFIVNELTPTAVEGLPLASQLAIVVTMHNIDESLSSSLGDIIPWVLTVSLVNGPDNGFLTGVSVSFVHGQATFESLTFSHPGEYLLEFSVTYPLEADFYVASQSPVTVTRRDLGLRILQQPQDGNITFELYPYPSVELVDLSNGASRVNNHSWRNTAWFVEVLVEGTGDIYRIQLASGVVTFDDLHIYSAGSYNLVFVVFQVVDGNREFLDYISSVSQGFSVIEVALTRFFYVFQVDFQSTVGDDSTEFREVFRGSFLALFPDVEVVNVTVARAEIGAVVRVGGRARAKRAEEGIEVSLFITARHIEDLIDAIAVINLGPDPESPFAFGDILLVPSSITQDPNLPVMSPSSGPGHALYLSLATIIPAVVFFMGGVLSVLIGVAIYKKLHIPKIAAFIRVRTIDCHKQESWNPLHVDCFNLMQWNLRINYTLGPAIFGSL